MDTTNILNKFVKQFSESLPPSLQGLRSDFEAHLHQGLKHWLSTLPLVTREEFNTQVQVLERLQNKVELLEQKLNLLEAQIHGKI